MKSVEVSSAVPARLHLPVTQYIKPPLQLNRLLAGALVFRRAPQLQVLLLRRAPTDSSPGKWERPGGCFDLDDETLLACAVRELREETGLRATHIHCCVGMSSMTKTGDCAWGSAIEDEQPVYDDGLTVVQWDGETWATLTLLVEADLAEIKLIDAEHDLWSWVTEDEVLAFNGGHGRMDYISEGVWRTVLEGFRLKKAMELR